jgi:hypothetical protein
MLVGLAPGLPRESQFARRLAENGCRPKQNLEPRAFFAVSVESGGIASVPLAAPRPCRDLISPRRAKESVLPLSGEISNTI